MIRSEPVRILCAGNAYRADDGLGLAVADSLERGGLPAGIELWRTSGEATELLDSWDARSRVLLVDAAAGPHPGTIHRIDVTGARVPERLQTSSTHALSVAQAVELARALGRMPARLIIFAVEGEAFEIGQPMSDRVAGAIEPLAQLLLSEAAALQSGGAEGRPDPRARSGPAGPREEPMHELSLMSDLMRKISTIATEQRATAVCCVRVQLGALCHMSADHFREHFERAARGTLAEGAELELETETDPGAPDAQDIVLLSVDLAQPDA